VVIDDFDFVGMAFLPFETDPVLLVDPDAVLPFPFTMKAFQTISRRDGKFVQFSDTIYLVQLALSDCPQCLRAAISRGSRVYAVKYVLCTVVSKGLYHGSYYNGIHYTSTKFGRFERSAV
jgi:hypothetical protein